MATKILEAKKILEEYAPAGEFLAYISKEEAELLKSLGSSGTLVEETGIPSFQLPGYLEDTAKDYAKQATGAYSVPIDTSKFTGQQFVAGEDPLQTQAISLATQGVGAYQPYLTAAQQGLTTAGADVAGARADVAAAGADITGARADIAAAADGTDIAGARTAAAGLGALTGPTAYQPFMSPYQQDVIDASMTEYDRQAAMRQQTIRDQSLGVPGAFGGGREGVQQAEYQTGSDRNQSYASSRIITTRLWQRPKCSTTSISKSTNDSPRSTRNRTSSATIRTKWIRSRTGSASLRTKWIRNRTGSARIRPSTNEFR